MEALLVYLFIGAIVMIVRAANGGKKGKSAPTGRTQITRTPAGNPALRQALVPVSKPDAQEKKHPQTQPADAGEGYFFEPHRGSDGRLHPTEYGHSMKRMNFSELKDGFYQGYSFGDEGIDPCHESMLEDQALPSCEDDRQNPPVNPNPAFNLQFNGQSVVNAVVMSEVLNRKTAI